MVFFSPFFEHSSDMLSVSFHHFYLHTGVNRANFWQLAGSTWGDTQKIHDTQHVKHADGSNWHIQPRAKQGKFRSIPVGMFNV